MSLYARYLFMKKNGYSLFYSQVFILVTRCKPCLPANATAIHPYRVTMSIEYLYGNLCFQSNCGRNCHFPIVRRAQSSSRSPEFSRNVCAPYSGNFARLAVLYLLCRATVCRVYTSPLSPLHPWSPRGCTMTITFSSYLSILLACSSVSISLHRLFLSCSRPKFMGEEQEILFPKEEKQKTVLVPTVGCNQGELNSGLVHLIRFYFRSSKYRRLAQ